MRNTFKYLNSEFRQEYDNLAEMIVKLEKHNLLNSKVPNTTLNSLAYDIESSHADIYSKQGAVDSQMLNDAIINTLLSEVNPYLEVSCESCDNYSFCVNDPEGCKYLPLHGSSPMRVYDMLNGKKVFKGLTKDAYLLCQNYTSNKGRLIQLAEETEKLCNLLEDKYDIEKEMVITVVNFTISEFTLKMEIKKAR